MINVLWRGGYPQYIGVGPDTEFKAEQGIEQCRSWKEVRDFMATSSVYYGEECGSFHVLLAWEDEFKEDTTFYTLNQIYDMLKMTEFDEEYEEEQNEAC